MTNKANYIIFHPEKNRQAINVTANVLENQKKISNWKGKIWVDRINNNSNEDPFVFSNNWLYSYCHATQLKRKKSHCYLQKGSFLFFCSGNSANNKVLEIDTVFEIGVVHFWIPKPNLELPIHFLNHFRSNKSVLWNRHLKFPFDGIHNSVTHTYEAKIGKENSFIPITKNVRTSLKFEKLPFSLQQKIEKKVKGKYPVLIDNNESKFLINKLREKADILVFDKIKEVTN